MSGLRHFYINFYWTIMETIPSPRLGFLRGVFLANHLASTDNLTRTTKRQNIYQLKWKKALRWDANTACSL